MDLTTVVVPGAQSLVTAIVTDSWSQMRTALSKLWAHRRSANPSPDPDAAALDAAGAELDLAMRQAVTLAGQGPELDRAGRMELFWIGYLAGQLAARPELGHAIKELPVLLGAEVSVAPSGVTVIDKNISGTVRGNVVQADDVSGGIRFGR